MKAGAANAPAPLFFSADNTGKPFHTFIPFRHIKCSSTAVNTSKLPSISTYSMPVYEPPENFSFPRRMFIYFVYAPKAAGIG